MKLSTPYSLPLQVGEKASTRPGTASRRGFICKADGWQDTVLELTGSASCALLKHSRKRWEHHGYSMRLNKDSFYAAKQRGCGSCPQKMLWLQMRLFQVRNLLSANRRNLRLSPDRILRPRKLERKNQSWWESPAQAHQIRGQSFSVSALPSQHGGPSWREPQIHCKLCHLLTVKDECP